MEQKTVLIGDDEKNIVEMYKVAFEQAGFRVLTACNGNEVIAQAKNERPDALLLDINMPVKDGFEVLQEIHKDEFLLRALNKTYIVMLTNYSNPQDIEYCIKLGARDFIIKAEWKPSSVVAKVQKYFEKTGNED